MSHREVAVLVNVLPKYAGGCPSNSDRTTKLYAVSVRLPQLLRKATEFLPATDSSDPDCVRDYSKAFLYFLPEQSRYQTPV